MRAAVHGAQRQLPLDPAAPGRGAGQQVALGRPRGEGQDGPHLDRSRHHRGPRGGGRGELNL